MEKHKSLPPAAGKEEEDQKSSPPSTPTAADSKTRKENINSEEKARGKEESKLHYQGDSSSELSSPEPSVKRRKQATCDVQTDSYGDLPEGYVIKGSIANIVLSRIGKLNPDYVKDDPFQDEEDEKIDGDKLALEQENANSSMEEEEKNTGGLIKEESPDTTQTNEKSNRTAPLNENDPPSAATNEENETGGTATKDEGEGSSSTARQEIPLVCYRKEVKRQRPSIKLEEGREVYIVTGPYKGSTGKIVDIFENKEWLVVKHDDETNSLWTVRATDVEALDNVRKRLLLHKKRKRNSDISMKDIKALFLKALDEQFRTLIQESKSELTALKAQHRHNDASRNNDVNRRKKEDDVSSDDDEVLGARLRSQERKLAVEVSAFSCARLFAMQAFDEKEVDSRLAQHF